MNSKPAVAASGTVLVRGGHVLNVFTGELLEQDIVVEGERIKGLIPREDGGGLKDTFDEVIDVTGRVIVPGYVEPHAHIGLMAEPVATLEQMARTGTTALVVDTYALMVTLADDELGDVLDEFARLPTYVRWFVAPHARSFLVDEDEQFAAARVERLLEREDVVAIGELTRWPMVEQGEPDIVGKIRRARQAGKRVEGHGAGASPPRLQRLLWHGVTSDHEGITPEQVLERVRLGFHTMLRHSSLRPDLPELLRVFEGELGALQHSNRIMLTVDGPTPVWMNKHGYLDYLIRICIDGGLEPAAAYRMATLNPAMYYRMEHDVGAIAPGRRADLNVLGDLSDPTPVLVMAGGRVVAREGELVEAFPRVEWSALTGMRRPPGRVPEPELFAFAGAGAPAGPGPGLGSGAGPGAGEGPGLGAGGAGVGSVLGLGTGAGGAGADPGLGLDSGVEGAGLGLGAELGSGAGPGADEGLGASGGSKSDSLRTSGLRSSSLRSSSLQPSSSDPDYSELGSSQPGIPILEVAHTVLLRLVEPGETRSSDGTGTGAGSGIGTDSEALRVAVYDWAGRWMTRALVKGFVDKLGGLATSYSPAYQVTVMGQDADDMALATTRVMEAGGGVCLVERGEIVFWMSLERAGLFNELSWPELVAKLAEFEGIMRERGYHGHELLYALFFFGFDSLPDYRLTVKGVWDVRRQRVLAPPWQLG